MCLAGLAACSESSGPAGGASAPELRLEQVHRIGSADDPDQSLTTVGQVLIGRAGEIYVSQPQDARILVFDHTGGGLGTIGRRGSGPGEFMSLQKIGLLGDTLWATNALPPQVSYFSRTGDLLGSVSWSARLLDDAPSGSNYLPSAPQMLLEGGSALLEPLQARGVPPNFEEAGPLLWELARWFLRIDGSGEVLNTVARYISRETTVRVRAGLMTGFAINDPYLHTPVAALAVDGRGVIIVEREPAPDTRPATYQVTLIAGTGDTTFTRAIGYEPVAVTPADVGATVNAIIEDARANASNRPADYVIPPADEIERAIRSAGLVPATHVPVSGVASGQDGSIWLQGVRIPGDEAIRWTVLDPRGEVHGEVLLPENKTVVASQGDVLVVQEMDALDVPYLVRYRIER